MTGYIALLRGVNVSGHRMIKMSALRDLFVSLGFSDVESYIQSGNVVYRSVSRNTDGMESLIEKSIQKTFGFPVTVVVRSSAALGKVIKTNPFAGRKGLDTTRLGVMFLKSAPAAAAVKALASAPRKTSDEYHIAGDAVYLHCPNGFGKTDLTIAFFEKKLNIEGTARNWNSVNALFTMLS
jgi:uncharacterized protein (DUF1697 family)